jgi:hypothetical protein
VQLNNALVPTCQNMLASVYIQIAPSVHEKCAKQRNEPLRRLIHTPVVLEISTYIRSRALVTSGRTVYRPLQQLTWRKRSVELK